MAVKAIRVIFVLGCIIMGAIWASYLIEERFGESPETTTVLVWMLVGICLGGGVSLFVLALLHFVTQEIYEKIAPAIFSIVLAIVIGYGIGTYILHWYPDADPTMQLFVVVSMVLVFGFSGIMLGLTRASNWNTLISAVEKHSVEKEDLKLVDTSVIIDGRIADICESGFITGKLLIPRFILAELQNIADSADVLRRAKGRRGLDILKALQHENSKVVVDIINDDPEEINEVDSKLVYLAKKYNAKVLTNDFNLNKVAQIEGIIVLNINDLANALKPAVLPDERMEVKLIKDGKEPNQGIGYLDDGTMIVVDGGREFMGHKVEVIVTSVLQTAAGRMIFTKFNSLIT